MIKLFTRWGFGLGAIGAAAAIILFIGLIGPNAQAKAAQVLAKGAQAIGKLKSIHFRGQARTLPADNFSQIGPEYDLVSIEFWKQFEPELQWKVEKPGRVAVMDGQSTLLYLTPPGNLAVKTPHPTATAFDTDWIHRIGDLSQTITEQLQKALASRWDMSLAEEQGADGRTKSVVTIHSRTTLPAQDVFKNKFFDLSDTRQVYRFDVQTELLDSVQAYLLTKSGEVLVFELTQIDYNPALDAAVFQLQLPADVRWLPSNVQQSPDNQGHSSVVSAKEAARAFFEACAREDWVEVQKYWKLPVDDEFQQYLGRLELISLGEARTSALAGTAQSVPYEIKLKSGEARKHAIAMKKDGKTGGWYVDGGI